MTLAYVGLGANLDEPRRQVRTAIEALRSLPQTRLVAVSDLYRTAPLGHADQPDFINAVAQLDTELPAEHLLEELQAIERRHGRERSFANAPRTLDLDLLLVGEQVMNSPRLVLPHPRMHERAFVLEPLTAIAPGVVIPGRGPAAALLAACAGQDIERLH
jgi:2-amino-4-hydroxy-6-hydroxymethyldihydropteridine diphosphokinase